MGLGGSGWFADSEGLLLTAAHVIGRPGRQIEVLMPGPQRIEAKLLAINLGHDLALLQVPPREDGYPALPVAEKLPAPGEEVWLLGTPLFRHNVLVKGSIAADATEFMFFDGRYVESVHIAATVPGGMSGGAWFDRQGRVVALQSSVISQNSIPIGVAGAVPCTAIRDLLKSRRNAATPTLGTAVEELWQHGREVLQRFPPKTEALVLRMIRKDGPAARAGLKEWDAVAAADGKPTRLSTDLLRIVRSKKAGETLKLTVIGPDGAGTRQVEVRLGKLEVAWPEAK